MKKNILLCVSILIFLASSAHKTNAQTIGTLIDQGILESSNGGTNAPAPVYINNLTVGAQYRIVISGTIDLRTASFTGLPHLYADAQWMDTIGQPLCYCIHNGAISLNSVRPISNDYQTVSNPAHTYTWLWTANSTQLEIYINDSKWDDNAGTLTYQVYYDAPPSYSAGGSVYQDNNKNGVKDIGEATYPGPITITANRGTVNTSGGTYTVNGVNAGNVTISYTGLPTGYALTYPLNGPPPSLQVRVGPACDTSSVPGASCVGGAATNVDFGITSSTPWMQSYGLDVRFDNGYTNTIPPAPLYPRYASVQDVSSTTPGIIYSGDSTMNVGSGQTSTTNWNVGGTTYPEVFSQGAGTTGTSYQYLLDKATHAGITPINLTTLPTCSNLANCTLPPNLPNGVYQATGNVTVNTYTFPVNRNYVFLINGTLTLNGNLTTPNGSMTLFSASSDIVVSSTVGAATNTFPLPPEQLQGVFSTDKNFTIEGINDCITGADRMLNVEGAIIINATFSGGNLKNQRDLCGDNTTIPSFTMRPRLDFLLNAPAFLMKQTVTFNEDAP